jgi:hypothetical protein
MHGKLMRAIVTVLALLVIAASCGFSNATSINLSNFSKDAQVQALLGGGTTYTYEINGVKDTYFIPPKNFNPLSATNDQLKEYGFPSRPTDPDRLKLWVQVRSKYKEKQQYQNYQKMI